jgi:hypothetical protein
MEEGSEPGSRERRLRTDHRTGEPVLLRDAAFWQDHERRRLEQGLSLAAYCKANGLAISTYRYRMKPGSRKKAAPGRSETVVPQFVPVQVPGATLVEHSLEIVAGEMTIRLHGAAAQKVLQQVLEKLA